MGKNRILYYSTEIAIGFKLLEKAAELAQNEGGKETYVICLSSIIEFHAATFQGQRFLEMALIILSIQGETGSLQRATKSLSFHGMPLYYEDLPRHSR